ncbi:MAG: putative toxin-antitoxin system toxin component, PIN family [Methanomicrobiales archaeon]|nr:putative toxin-antitoxin system toxin component, PIN family [Methanomicrobiales archaeon]
MVLDTNVLVSGLLSSNGAPSRILNLVINGNVIIVLDTRIFDEYSEVLRREKFSFPKDAVNEIIAFVRREGVFISPRPLNGNIPDPGDLPFIEVSYHAKVPIVTGNLRHFKGSDVVVMTPVQFLSGTVW